MEPLRGIPLEQWLSAPAADAQAALDARIEVMLQICDVLQAVHEKSITHGDLRPASVFVQRDGGVKVLDFGSGPSRVTHGYASPEQLMGRTADSRSDLFSAAALFYLMLKGRAPFAGPDAAAIRGSVLHTEPAALSTAEAPEALARAVIRALSKDPDARQPSTALLRAEIAQVRSLKNGHHTRMVWAALDRYRRIEGLINERRGLGRRLGISNIDKSCDESFARLAVRFPALARAGGDDALLPEVPFDQAADDLSQLQQWHNDELAEVAVLRTIEGGAAGQGFLDRASGFFKRWQPDSDTLEGSK
jgi:serine/threonine protein kinase